MKTTAVLVSALFGAVCAQDISTLPQCGQSCIQGMLAKQGDLGCPPVNNQPDAACLCRNPDFSFGLRDCATEACGGSVAAAVLNFGVEYCRNAGVAIPTTVVTTDVSTPTPTPGESGSPTAESSTAIATSSFVTTVTSGEATVTSSVVTTIYGPGGSGPTATATATLTATSVSSEASQSASRVASSASSAATSATGAMGSAASSAAGSATSTTAGAFAPQMTASPIVGFLAAAGVAAMLL